MKYEHKLYGEFGDYKIVEELDDEGTAHVSFHMDPPPNESYSVEIWSWTGRSEYGSASARELLVDKGGTMSITTQSPPRRANVRGHDTEEVTSMHDDRIARNRYYFSAVYEIIAESEEEAGRLFEGLCAAPDDDRARLLDSASGMDGMEPGEADEPDGPVCDCPPELVARGGFKGGCPVHS